MRRSACFALAVLLTLPARAQDAPAAAPTRRLPTPEQLEAATGEWWYGIYLNGRKSGWAHLSFKKDGAPEAPWVARSELRLEALSMGEKLSMHRQGEERFQAAAPFHLVASKDVESDGQDRLEREVTRGEDGLTLVVRSAGEEQTVALGALDYGLQDTLAAALWIASKPDQGAKVEYSELDLDEGELSRTTLTLLDTETRQAGGVETTLYRCSEHDEREGEQGVLLLDPQGTIISALYEGLFELRLEPEQVAKQLEAAADLFVEGTAKLDQPLGETDALSRVRLRVEGEGRGELASGPGQEVRREGDAVILVLDPKSAPRVAATPEEIERALRATPDVPAEHPEVVRLSREAVRDARTDAEKVERLVHFVSEYVEDAYGADAMSVLEVVRRKRGDCTEHAALFTALARAARIPARAAGGLGYMGDEEQAFGGHAWNEVVLDGAWVAVDATWDQVRADPGHIRLGHDGGPDVFGRVFGRVRFVLVSKE